MTSLWPWQWDYNFWLVTDRQSHLDPAEPVWRWLSHREAGIPGPECWPLWRGRAGWWPRDLRSAVRSSASRRPGTLTLWSREWSLDPRRQRVWEHYHLRPQRRPTWPAVIMVQMCVNFKNKLSTLSQLWTVAMQRKSRRILCEKSWKGIQLVFNFWHCFSCPFYQKLFNPLPGSNMIHYIIYRLFNKVVHVS